MEGDNEENDYNKENLDPNEGTPPLDRHLPTNAQVHPLSHQDMSESKARHPLAPRLGVDPLAPPSDIDVPLTLLPASGAGDPLAPPSDV
ncbi:hypothetical protein BGZ88_007346, partial [Linnemannia elongata]